MAPALVLGSGWVWKILALLGLALWASGVVPTLPRPERMSHRIVEKAPQLLRALIRHGVEAEVVPVHRCSRHGVAAQAPGQPDPSSEWRHWPEFAALGVAAGLLWGFLSRNDPIS